MWKKVQYFYHIQRPMTRYTKFTCFPFYSLIHILSDVSSLLLEVLPISVIPWNSALVNYCDFVQLKRPPHELNLFSKWSFWNSSYLYFLCWLDQHVCGFFALDYVRTMIVVNDLHHWSLHYNSSESKYIQSNVWLNTQFDWVLMHNFDFLNVIFSYQ